MSVFHRLSAEVFFGSLPDGSTPGEGGERFEFSLGMHPTSEALGAWTAVIQGFYFCDPAFDEAWFSECSTSWQLPWEASAARPAPQARRGRVVYSRRVGM